jgi:hypothetical protein
MQCQQSYVNTICKSIRVTILIFSDLSGGKWCPQTKYMYRKHETLYWAKKNICGFPVSRPYLAFGRRNPDPKLFYWIMLVSVST